MFTGLLLPGYSFVVITAGRYAWVQSLLSASVRPSLLSLWSRSAPKSNVFVCYWDSRSHMKFVRIRRQLLELSCNRQTLSDRQTDKGKTDIFGACNNPFFPRHRVVIKKHRVAEADKLTQHVTDRQTDAPCQFSWRRQQSWSLSVKVRLCPSRSCIVSTIQTAEDIVKLLSWPDSPIILVFDPKRRYPIPRRTPSAGMLNTPGWEKICDFRQIAVYLGNGTR